MMNPVNPYHANHGDKEKLAVAPFAGRQDAYARLYARLFEPVSSGAILFLGRRHIGKTALLYSVSSVFKESAVSIVIALSEIDPDKESTWLLALAQIINTAFIDQGFTLSRLSQLDAPGDDVRGWFEATFLPQIIGAARRKVLLLLDDADRLLMAVRGGQLPDDTFAYLLSLTKKFPSLYIALTLDADYEDAVEEFAPLVTSKDVLRLGALAPDETQWLLQAPVRGLYTVPDECAIAIQRVTGGAPALAQHFGYQFFKRWEAAPDLNVFTLEDIKSITPAVYLYNEADYRDLWERLNPNEKNVLTAISRLLYDDPLGRIDAAILQNWLVDTDFPLDITAINATLRSLEYRDLLQPTPAGIALSADIMQTWLLENARLGAQAPSVRTPNVRVPVAAKVGTSRLPPPPQPKRRGVSPRLLRALAIIFVLLVIANVIAYAWVNGGTPTVPPDAQPTVTLANAP